MLALPFGLMVFGTAAAVGSVRGLTNTTACSDRGLRPPVTDALESMEHRVVFGTNVSINLEPDTRGETARLFRALAEGSKVTTELSDMFRGACFGT